MNQDKSVYLINECSEVTAAVMHATLREHHPSTQKRRQAGQALRLPHTLMHFFLTMLFFLACLVATVDVSAADAGVPASNGVQSCTNYSDSWSFSGNTATSTSSNGVGISVSMTANTGAEWKNYANETMNTINAWSENTVQGATSFGHMFQWDTTPGSSGTDSAVDGEVGTFTINFDTPVTNPVIHFDRLGGYGGLSGSMSPNSTIWTLTTAGANLTRLSGPDHFVVETKRLFRGLLPNIVLEESQSSLDPASGTAAGSVMVIGTYSQLTFEVGALGNEGIGGDFIEMVLCMPDSPAIDAVDDDFRSPVIESAVGGTTTSVIALDTLNGEAAVIGTADGEISLNTSGNTSGNTAQDGTTPLGLAAAPATGSITLNPDGTLTVAEDTTPGIYAYTYEICEATNLSLCDTAVATVVVDMIQSCTNYSDSWNFSGNTATSTSSNGVGISLSMTANTGAEWKNYANETMNTINAWSENTVQGATSFGHMFQWDTTPGSPETDSAVDGEVGTFTINFDTPVTNPVIHFDRLGGYGGLSGSISPNSTIWTLTTAGANLTRLSGPDHFVVETKRLFRELLPNSVPEESQSSLDPASGTAAGSVMVIGTYSQLTFEVDAFGPEGIGGDFIEMVLCTPDSPVIDAVDDDFRSPVIESAVGGTTTSVIALDTLNGEAAVIGTADGEVSLNTSGNTPGNTAQDGTTPLGLATAPATGSITLNPDGTLTVAEDTTPGIYAYTYEICEATNLSLCDTAVATVVVDMIQSCTNYSGSWSFSGNTATSTSINGVGITLSMTANTGAEWKNYANETMNTINAWSENTVQGATSFGHMFQWDTSPGSPETDSTVDGEVGTFTINFDTPVTNPVIHFDRLGGYGGFSGSMSPNSTIWTLTTAGANLTRLSGPDHFVVETKRLFRELLPNIVPEESQSSLDPASGTAAGSVMVIGTYSQLTFEVDAFGPEGIGGDFIEMVLCTPDSPVINAQPETFPIVDGAVGGTTTSVLASDTLDGNPVTIADVDLTVENSDPALTLDPLTGLITVAPNTPAGTYTVEYKICDKANPGICDTTVETVTVGAIDAQPETFPIVDGENGGTTTSVLDSDTLGGNPVTIADVDLTVENSDPALTLDPLTGLITVAPNTPAGTYTVEYKICDKANPGICDTTVETVTVGAIDAQPETFPIVDGENGGTTTSVLDSDTLGGNPVTIADVDLTVENSDPALTLDPATGLITVAPNTPAGTYTVEYKICDKANPGICDTTIETVTVGAIDAQPETFPIVDGENGGITTSVLDSDTLGGNPVTIADVDLTVENSDPALTLDPATGLITVAPNTPAGTYTVEYKICDKANPGICDTTIETVTVGAIDAQPETFPIVDGENGGTTTSVLDSDTLGGNPVTIADVDLTVENSDPALTLDPATGLITVAPNTPAGTYTVEYKICDKANPGICDTTIETVMVGAIDAQPETFPTVDGENGGTTTSVLTSDTLGGNPVTIADVDLTVENSDPALTLDPLTGLITVAPNTPAGTYTVEYKICDKANPGICDTTVETVTVGAIDAQPETFPIVDGENGGTTTSVLDSDTLGGNPVTIADVDLTVENSDPALTLDPATGLITVAPNTPAGTYTVEYKICDKANPGICDTTIETVTVGAIDAQPETFPIVDGENGGITTSVLDSDTLGGNPVTIADVDLTVENSDPALTLDPATGLITVAPNTPAGTYTVEYKICDKANPGICDTTVETVTVGEIDAQPETFPIVDGDTGGTTTSVLDSDTLGGNPVTIADVDLTVENSDPALTLDPATGLITVAPNTPAGTYTVEYKICDKANPGICDTTIETVTVGEIDAQPETFPIVDGDTGGTTTSVLDSDTLGGNPVTIADVDLTVENSDPALTLDPATGLITVAPNTPAGTYTVEYKICDKANPGICDTTVETVTVGAIDAQPETFPIVDGDTGGTTTSVLDSDTLGGNPVTIADVDLTVENSDPALTLDPLTGLITVAPNTPAGTYSVEYKICDKANPGICDTTIETVTVGVIDAQPETFPTVDGENGGTTTSVLTSDTLGGNPVTIADVDLTVENSDPALTLDPATGLITVAPNTPAGTYTVEYKICDKANPGICDTTVETVTVGVIDAQPETFPIVDGENGGTTTSVLDSDTLGGNPVTIADVDLTVENSDPALTLDPATGLITVAPNTPAGTYTVEYKICDKANPGICDTTVETVTVGAIDAQPETFPIVDGENGGTTTSVLDSDTLGGNPVTIADVDLTVENSDPALTLDPATGLITVAPNTPAGTYTVEYKICDKANPGICDTTTETVTVGEIDAQPETFPIVDGDTGGTTTSVLDSDTLGGNPVTIADVDLTVENSDPALTLDPLTGLITVAPNTPAGTYTVEYKICDKANPGICDTTVETVTVGVIDAQPETFPIVDGENGGTTTSVLDSDTLGGNPVTIADVDLTVENSDPALTLDPLTGLITVAPNTPAGTYTVEYKICDKANPGICDTTIETVTVGVIDAQPETFPTVDGDTGGTTTSVLDSDTLGGNPVTIADVDLTVENSDPALTLDPATGLITVAPNTPAGTYTVEYKICDKANPGICDTTTETVMVGVIDAQPETFPTVDGENGGTTTSVLTSDTLGGNPITDPTTVTVTEGPATGGLTLNPDHEIVIPAGTPDGVYTLEYTICDAANASICDTVTETVTVGAIDAQPETFPIVDGDTGGTTTSVLDSDTLDGNPVTIADVDLTVENSDPALILDPLTGLITVAPNTPAGTYTVEYKICDKANPGICDTTIETVTVGVIDAQPETFPTVDGENGGTTTSVLTSDTLGGNPITDPTTVTVTEGPATGGLTLNPDHEIVIPAGTPDGVYTLEYTICDADNASICDTVTETVTVEEQKPDLELSKVSNKTSVRRGDQLVYTLTLSNTGAGDANEVTVQDKLPAGLTHVSNNPEQGTYNPIDGVWDVGSLTAGESVVLTITVTID